jgi:hypothetical protein
MKNSNDTIGNRTRDLPARSAVPLLKAVNNLYMAVDDYGYDYMHIVFDLYHALWCLSYDVDKQNASLFDLIYFHKLNLAEAHFIGLHCMMIRTLCQ